MSDGQQAKKSGRGGKRPGAGRPQLDPAGKVTTHAITLLPGMANKIADVTEGNLSEAVRYLWFFYLMAPEATRQTLWAQAAAEFGIEPPPSQPPKAE